MRIGRLVAGVATFVFALWIIIGEQITGASSDAVVNARLTTVRAPIAGTINMPFRPFGAQLNKTAVVATITNNLVDTIRLDDLQSERETIKGQILSLKHLQSDMSDQMQQLEERITVYRDERLAEIDMRLVRANERLHLLEADLTEEQLAVLSPISDSDAVTAVPAQTIAISLARETVEALEISREAALQGVFLGDGYNDAPNAEQRLGDLQTRQDTTTADLLLATARLAATAERIDAEELSVNKLTNASLIAPSKGVLWEVLVDDGEVVQRGQDLLRLMKCSSAVVTLSVPDNVYNRLTVGQLAQFRLDGEREVFDGTITRIAGAGAAKIYDNLAVAPSLKHLERYDVTLLVPSLRERDDLDCAVGRTGRVFFDSRPLDWFRRLGH